MKIHLKVKHIRHRYKCHDNRNILLLKREQLIGKKWSLELNFNYFTD